MPTPPFPGGDSGTTGGGGTTSRIRQVDTFADLKSVLPAYKELSFVDILTQLSRNGITFTPTFYKEIQASMLALEAQSGVSVNTIANARRVVETIQKAVEQGVSGGRGGGGGDGGGRGATPSGSVRQGWGRGHQYRPLWMCSGASSSRQLKPPSLSSTRTPRWTKSPTTSARWSSSRASSPSGPQVWNG